MQNANNAQKTKAILNLIIPLSYNFSNGTSAEQYVKDLTEFIADCINDFSPGILATLNITRTNPFHDTPAKPVVFNVAIGVHYTSDFSAAAIENIVTRSARTVKETAYPKGRTTPIL